MKKRTILKTFLITIAIVIITTLVIFLTPSCKDFIYEILGIKQTPSVSESSKNIDVLERSRQYNLLYSLSLKNSITPECNWENISFDWQFSNTDKLLVYKTSVTIVELEESTEIEAETYKTINEAIEVYLENHPKVEESLDYDYQVEIFSEEIATYDKTPLFSTVNNMRILTSQLGVWRNLDSEYAAGLYEVSNSFKQFAFDKNDPYFSFPAKSDDQIKEEVIDTQLKFLNHEFLCEQEGVEKATIMSIEIIYIHINEYLVPVYKIIGEFKIGEDNITWTALVNPIDFSKLDFTIYEDTKLDFVFIPKPVITNLTLQNDKYYVEGYAPNKLVKNASNTITANEIKITFDAREKAGEYMWTRKEALQQEINNSLEVEKGSGKFKFNFSSDNFWLVEKIHYEDEYGKTLEEPYHSKDDETERIPVDNWFKVRECLMFENEEYCTKSSDVYYLQE